MNEVKNRNERIYRRRNFGVAYIFDLRQIGMRQEAFWGQKV